MDDLVINHAVNFHPSLFPKVCFWIDVALNNSFAIFYILVRKPVIADLLRNFAFTALYSLLQKS